MPSDASTDVSSLIAQLADTDGVKRERAREQLVKLRMHEVTQALVVELNDPRAVVRWEAAKALMSIADPVAAPALVFHLDDDDDEIRWLAAEGLAELGEPGLLATLSGAMRFAQSTHFCKAAHQVFRTFEKKGLHPNELNPVIHACEGAEPAVFLPVESYKALHLIRTGKAPDA